MFTGMRHFQKLRSRTLDNLDLDLDLGLALDLDLDLGLQCAQYSATVSIGLALTTWASLIQ